MDVERDASDPEEPLMQTHLTDSQEYEVLERIAKWPPHPHESTGIEDIREVARVALAGRKKPTWREWRICRLCWEAWLPDGDRNDCVCEDPQPFSAFEIAARARERRKD